MELLGGPDAPISLKDLEFLPERIRAVDRDDRLSGDDKSLIYFPFVRFGGK